MMTIMVVMTTTVVVTMTVVTMAVMTMTDDDLVNVVVSQFHYLSHTTSCSVVMVESHMN